MRTTNQTAVATRTTSNTTAITVPVWRRVGETVGDPVTGVGAVEKSIDSGVAGSTPAKSPNGESSGTPSSGAGSAGVLVGDGRETRRGISGAGVISAVTAVV